LPEEGENREAFFQWLKEKQIDKRYLTINSASYNSLMNQEREKALREGQLLSIPGVPQPTAFETVGFRKENNMSTQTHKKLNEVATQGPTSIAPIQEAPRAPIQEVLAKDILIARLLNMQGLSDLVVEKKAQTGEFIRSTTEEKLGDDKSVIDFIPLKVTMEWMEKEKVGAKFEFRKMVARTAMNDNAPWTFWRNPQGQEADKAGVLLGATEWKRVKVLNVYSLLPKDVDGFEAELKRLR
jgi:hypothetical protein